MNSNTEDHDDGPRIIVDDDWKAKVAAEKEQAATESTSGANDEAPRDFPKPTLEILVSTYSTQAMMALGFIPDPVTGKPAPNRPLAKHLIDMIGVIQEISKGNLTEDQDSMLEDILHQLRMAYVSAPAVKAQPEPVKKSAIELP